MIARFFHRRRNERHERELNKLRAEVVELQTQLNEERSKVRIRDLEIDLLADVIARDRERVAAETAEFARRAAEGT